MLINIKTSESNKQIVSELTRKLNFGSENIIARIAFSYSLSKNYKWKLFLYLIYNFLKFSKKKLF